MSNTKISVLLCTLVLIQAIFACPGFNKDDLVQVGSITYSSPATQNARENCQSVAINYNVPYTGFQSALCTNNYLFSRHRFWRIQFLQRNRLFRPWSPKWQKKLIDHNSPH